MSKHLAAALILLAACTVDSQAPPSTPAQGGAGARADVGERQLQAGQFAEAARAADGVLARDGKNARAAAVRALARYQGAMETLWRDGERAVGGERIDDARLHAVLMAAEADLARVDAELAVAAADPTFSLELCLACWERDWNQSGEIDDRD